MGLRGKYCSSPLRIQHEVYPKHDVSKLLNEEDLLSRIWIKLEGKILSPTSSAGILEYTEHDI